MRTNFFLAKKSCLINSIFNESLVNTNASSTLHVKLGINHLFLIYQNNSFYFYVLLTPIKLDMFLKALQHISGFLNIHTSQRAMLSPPRLPASCIAFHAGACVTSERASTGFTHA